MTDMEILGAAIAYIKQALDGVGALKGAPCTIKSKTPITGGTRITFGWTSNSGVEQETTLDVMDGEDGKGIYPAYVVGETPYASDWLSFTDGGLPLAPAANDSYVIVDGLYKNQLYRWDEDAEEYEKMSGGGGGGTDDYTDLSHKPQVNGHTLEGNKTTSDLGIKFEDLPDAPTIPNDLADLQDDSSHRLVTDTEKATWDGKSDFSGAYADLTGLPTLGTASSKDVPATGDASSSQVVLGSDSRLTDSRPASDVSSWAKQSTKPTYTASEVGAIATTQKGVASGVAELDSNGKVPSSQLPSYVDDVIEGYYNTITDRFYTESTFENVIPPESGKSWVDVASNKSYRWTGSVYSRVDEGVQLGETSGSAYRGDRGKTAYDHSQTTGNPHGTTASDVGLSNVPNVSTNDQTPTFTEASTRNNIASGEKLSLMLGKISKFFNDLKTVAFTGSFSDLSNKPENSNTFLGTIAEWNQLTTAEKKAYDHASIPDSLDGNVMFPASKVMMNDGASVEADLASAVPRTASGTTTAQLVTAIGQLSETQKATCVIDIVYAGVHLLLRRAQENSYLCTLVSSSNNNGTVVQYYLNTAESKFSYIRSTGTTSQDQGALSMTSWTLYYQGTPIS